MSAVTLLLLLISLLVHAQQPPTVASGTPGRYRLISSPVSPLGLKGTANPDTTVFRIDTATGKTWRYMTGLDKEGKIVNGWLEVAE